MIQAFALVNAFFENLSIRSTKIKTLAHEIASREPLITKDILPEFVTALNRLQSKLKEPVKKKFYHYTTLKTHILPLTNVTFDKAGAR